MPDEPAQVTRDLLLSDPSIEPVPLKVFAPVTRPGLRACVVAAFNVNKAVAGEAGVLSIEDLGWSGGGRMAMVAAYRPLDRSVTLIEAHPDAGSHMPFSLNAAGYEILTLVTVEGDVAVLGLLDKYLSPAAVLSVTRGGGATVVRLAEAGDFGAWLARRPVRVEVDGRPLSSSSYTYRGGVLRVPRESFAARGGEREVRIVLGQSRKRD
jgi:hypothetical protein